MKNITYIFILLFANLSYGQKASVKDTIYVDTTKQLIIYLPEQVVNLKGEFEKEAVESKTAQIAKEAEVAGRAAKATAEETNAALQSATEEAALKAEAMKANLEAATEAAKATTEKTNAKLQAAAEEAKARTDEIENEDSVLKPKVSDKDYDLIHKTNRILVWRLIKRFMYYSDLKYSQGLGINKSMENFKELFQNNAVIYNDLLKNPEHVDYRDYFDDISEYFDNVKIDQDFEDVWIIYNRLFQSDLKALETESNYSDGDNSSFYYELPVKKYVSNKIGDDGKIIQLEKPEEYNLRFKILVDYQELEAQIVGIYLN